MVINSSAYHSSTEEIQHGRIAESTLKLVKESLDQDDFLLNIMLCHHNPHKHSEIQLGEHDEIKGGQLLLDLIGEPQRQDWLVIHGHKHHPKITYASGGNSSPIVFSAGSSASTLYPELINATGNQFYILEFDEELIKNHGLIGRFRSWDWHPGFGWQAADNMKGLPAFGGFGHRENAVLLARRIEENLSNSNNKHLMSEKVYDSFPELYYLTPNDLLSLERALESLSVVVAFSDEGLIHEVCKV
ncbi:hypothetical protein [Gimesia aquarii]|uniref:hypothetical protein n=1 Tax=Gimesia aquarii TaxID=2527964 RepID=UPI001E42EF36|nr:hypothetical protein [Gimesia aquarii]